MSDEISVGVASYGEGRNLMMVYFDPITGKKVAKTSGTTDRTAAERAAGVWEDELNNGRYQAPSRLTWKEFRKRYEAEKLAGLARGTRATAGESLDCFERIVNPDRLVKLTPAVMSRFQAELRKPREIVKGDKKIIKPPTKDTTIARHLRHVKAALRWGAKVGLLAKAPNIEMPRLAKGQALMRGRAITAEEFDRMIAAIPKVRPYDTPAWERLLRGLWLSGLRLGEALTVSWDQDAPFSVDLTGRRPALRIFAEAQKARRDDVIPLTPDFAEFLQATPEAERVGRVFLLIVKKTNKPMVAQEVGRMVSAIGKKAGVVVNKADGKFASAHDLRRAFGTRWARRVMPAVLKRLMRHSTVQTTMGYYVDLDAAEVADELWAGWGANGGKTPPAGNTLGNTRPETVEADAAESCRKSLPSKVAEAGLEPARAVMPTGF
jgi:integrase